MKGYPPKPPEPLEGVQSPEDAMYELFVARLIDDMFHNRNGVLVQIKAALDIADYKSWEDR